jgi:hypothetical protein
LHATSDSAAEVAGTRQAGTTSVRRVLGCERGRRESPYGWRCVRASSPAASKSQTAQPLGPSGRDRDTCEHHQRRGTAGARNALLHGHTRQLPANVVVAQRSVAKPEKEWRDGPG